MAERKLRDCKYGRNSVTKKCYKKGEKGSTTGSTKKSNKIVKRGEKVEKAAAVKKTSKNQRECKYGRKMETGKCYTKAERAKMDKNNHEKPKTPTPIAKTPKKTINLEEQKAITEDTGKITAMVALDDLLVFSQGNKIKFWDVSPNSIRFNHQETYGKIKTTKIESMAISDTKLISTTSDDVIELRQLNSKLFDEYMRTKNELKKVGRSIAVTEKYAAVSGLNRDNDLYIQVYSTTGIGRLLGICRDKEKDTGYKSYKTVGSIAIHENVLFSVNDEKDLVIWDITKSNENMEFHSIDKIKQPYNCHSLDVNKNRLFALNTMGVKIWKIVDNRRIEEMATIGGEHIDAFAVSGDYLFTAKKVNSKVVSISVWDISHNEMIMTMEKQIKGEMIDLVASKDHVFLASPNEIAIWKF